MSYHVYITRAAFWAENEGVQIDADEWLQLVRTDPQLTLDEKNGPCFAVLTEARQQEQAWLDWSEGNVYANYPNRTLQRKMLRVAKRLGARLQGEDGEAYTTIGDFPASVRLPDRASKVQGGMSRYRRQAIIWAVITYGTIAAVIIAANVFDFW
ncbi:MAG: hypothetical protein WBN07_04975 [Woeseiaceae bacterium]|jgi:hypothetical protein